MKKVIVASLNPVKIKAVENGFKKMFPELKTECTGVSVPSEVSDQPMTDDETLLGAENRVKNASKALDKADFYVGIEGGVQTIGADLHVFAWIVIKSGDKIGMSKTSTFMLPKKVTSLVKQGQELGIANDIIFNKENSKQKNGAVGILTDNLIDRTRYYTEAVILALVPLKNEDLYYNA